MPLSSQSRILLFAILLLAASSLQVSAFALAPQSNAAKPVSTNNAPQSEVIKLELSKPIEREMKGGESHAYEITLEAGQFLDLVVDQRGIDVVVQVVAPDGKQLLEVDSPNGTQGPEPVKLIAEAAGTYRFQVLTQSCSRRTLGLRRVRG
jgi:hypothetical protein